MDPKRRVFSIGKLVRATLWYFCWPFIGVVLAVAVTTAVLVGALVLGDSLRHSLRHQAIDRLGAVDDALFPAGFLRQDCTRDWQEKTHVYSQIVPVIRVSASLENPSGNGDRTARANGVQIIGCPPAFWTLGHVKPTRQPQGREIVLNEKTAELLHAKVGDRIVVWLPVLHGIPAESSLGRRADVVKPSAAVVVDIVTNENLGAFQLAGSQEIPRNAYVDLAWIAEEIGQPGGANVVLFSRKAEFLHDTGKALAEVAQLSISPEDYGLHVTRTRRGYLFLTTERLIFDPATEKAVTERVKDLKFQRVFIYLAERVTCPNGEAWYATVAAVPLVSDSPFGPFLDTADRPVTTPAEDECVLNEWMAQRLKVKPGEQITLTYFAPETDGGDIRRETAVLKVKAIVRLQGAAADPELVPEVRGLTDKKTIADWDPPFPFDPSRVTREDEEYWAQYRATPKIFVSPEFAEEHWASRYGKTTGIRVLPTNGLDEESLRARLTLSVGELGWQLQPVREQALNASQGTTPFDVLFLAFNLFVVVASLLLTGLLFVLNVEKRANQLGLVRAVGWPRTRVLFWLLGESSVLTVVGTLGGVLLGVGYAKLLTQALHTIWLPALGVPFLHLAVTPFAIILGIVLGIACSLLVTVVMTQRFVRFTPQVLLMGTWASEGMGGTKSGREYGRAIGILVAVIALVGAILLAGLGFGSDERTQAGAFFGSGALMLFGLWQILVLWFRGWLRMKAVVRRITGLAARNLGRNPTRSALSTILMGLAVFLVISVSSFHLDVSDRGPDFTSGDGGFWLVGESDHPIFSDLNSVAVRRSLGLSDADLVEWKNVRIYALRRRAGEDASCLNLYRTREPIVLGIDDDVIARGGFRFTSVMKSAENRADSNPWELLKRPPVIDAEGVVHVPAIVDDATAKYAFQKWRGVGENFEMVLPTGKRVAFQFVGLLDNSIFQGRILIWERTFRELFPDVAGYRYFLIEIRSSDDVRPLDKTLVTKVQQFLEKNFAAEGLQLVSTREKLRALYAVQNTYLSTFQSLGGLGLLLGTIGLGAVVFRGVVERQTEIALLRAVGFSANRVHLLVLVENMIVLLLGLGIGVISSLLAVAPQLLSGRGHVPWQAAITVGALMLLIGFATGHVAGRWIARQQPAMGLRRE
ncbi:ABC transporter permease [Thermogutta sp.]|uniref:ABC transporter permease n=1 Tax=Thermogutta sp. TaxID=1962930 RepID=UPI00322052C0